jgi:4-aminobutyrate aminotransferase-like enzyme
VGEALLSGLRALAARHPDTMGDVRGQGLFLGIEVSWSNQGAIKEQS